MRVNTSKKRILLVLSIMLIAIVAFICELSFLHSSGSETKPVGGVLDMENWNESDGILNLSGEWDFYWNRFVTYQEIADKNISPDLTVAAPMVWNSYEINNEKLTAFGYGTYRLRVVNASIGQPLAFRLPAFVTSYEFYINDTLLAHDGKVGTDMEHSAPGCKPKLAEFTPDEHSFEIIIYVANFTYAYGGMYYPIMFGTAEQIQSMNNAIADYDLLLIGALFIMTFYFMCIFLLRREDRFSLYFVFVCLFLSGSTAISGDLLIFQMFPNISYDSIVKIMYVFICWFPVCLAFAFSELFPKEISKKVLRIFFVYAASITLFILLTPVSVYSRTAFFVNAVHFLIDMYILAALAHAIINGRKGATYMLISCVGILLCYIYEILFFSGAGKMAYFIMLVMMSFALAKRLTEAYRTESDLSQKLLTLDKIKDETIAKTLSIEAAFIQAQIKPHFLFNTLNTISSFCDTDPVQAGRLIDEFSDYLRRSFDFKNPEMLVPLEQELSLVKSYLEIEKARFGDELSVIFDVDESIATKIPLLSIQPLIENAINHGLRKRSGNGTVTLSIHKVANGMEIAVRDDGQGISEDKLKTLLLPEDGQGIGLWNIDKRLKRLYGNGLSIKSEVNKGTAVSYIIPEEVG